MALTAGKLFWYAIAECRRGEQLCRLECCINAVHWQALCLEALGDKLTERALRIERLIRILEDHANRTPIVGAFALNLNHSFVSSNESSDDTRERRLP